MVVPFILPAQVVTDSSAPVPMWRYSLTCFSTMTSIVLIASYLNSRWGLRAPLAVGYGGIAIALTFSALLFARTHSRQLLAIERQRLTIGGFATLWFYNQLWPIVSHLLRHSSWNAGQILDVIFDTIIDYAYAWVLVRYVVVWMLQPAPPPNQRLERPVKPPLDAP